jgi:hypothetical protein
MINFCQASLVALITSSKKIIVIHACFHQLCFCFLLLLVSVSIIVLHCTSLRPGAARLTAQDLDFMALINSKYACCEHLYPDDDEDLSCKHKFKTWRSKIDGTGPGFHGEA